MSATLILAMFRQRASSPVRLVLLAFLFGMPLLIALASPSIGLSVLGDSFGLTLVVGAGLIGQDISSGVLQLLFARPITRGAYVLSRWTALGIAGTVLVVAQASIATLILTARGAAPNPQAVMLLVAESTLLVWGLGAVITLCSSLLGGFGDLAILFVAFVLGQVILGVGKFQNSPGLERVGTEIIGFLMPRVDLTAAIAAAAIPWFAIASYASTVTLCLALAVVIVNRKELSYASAG